MTILLKTIMVVFVFAYFTVYQVLNLLSSMVLHLHGYEFVSSVYSCVTYFSGVLAVIGAMTIIYDLNIFKEASNGKS